VSELRLRVHEGLVELGEPAWAGLVGESSPFLEWAWLQGLEETGCVGGESGWIPRHVSLWEGERLVAAAPAYVKLNSMGEFVYDWSWAHAARRLGASYYPKLVVGVPFTPVTGTRLLVAPGEDREVRRLQLVSGLRRLAEALGCSGLNLLFTTREETEQLATCGFAERLQFQYMWSNPGYADFDAFLARFRSKRRKVLRRERRAARETGLRLECLSGDALPFELLLEMYGHYDRTCDQYGGWRYLNRDFWEHLHAHWRPRLRLFTARDGDRLVAGALCVQKGQRLYGRYWGAGIHIPHLHFELCLYRPIEHAIEAGLEGFEPGQGGPHKFRRGFEPELCRSAHWLLDRRLDGPIRGFLREERAEVTRRRRRLLDESPIRAHGSSA